MQVEKRLKEPAELPSTTAVLRGYVGGPAGVMFDCSRDAVTVRAVQIAACHDKPALSKEYFLFQIRTKKVRAFRFSWVPILEEVPKLYR